MPLKTINQTKPKHYNAVFLSYWIIPFGLLCFSNFFHTHTHLYAHMYLYVYIFLTELVSDVLLWTHSHGRAKAGWPSRTYIQQLCEDTGCSPGDLQEAMNDKEGWWERVRDIRADGATRWVDDDAKYIQQQHQHICCSIDFIYIELFTRII